MLRHFLLAALFVLPAGSSAWGIEKVTIRREGKVVKVEGKVLIQDEAGSLFLQTADGNIWTLTAADVVDRQSDETPFKPLTRPELSAQVLTEMPAGCKVHHTEHYLICYNTTDAYATFCGDLFERFYVAFDAYWKELGWELRSPEMPLVALIFKDKESFEEHAPAGMTGIKSIVAYYNFGTNRVALYDLTGVDAKLERIPPAGAVAAVKKILTTKGANFNVATIVHEAAHQLTFNRGLHQRYADLPFWVLEGLPVYFETPDLRIDAKDWETIGDLNTRRLDSFRRSLKSRPKKGGGLERLLIDDKRFKATVTSREAYAEGWAFNYFLFSEKKTEYLAYLKKLSQKQPGIIDEPDERVTHFKAIFGDKLELLDAEFLKFMRAPKKK